MKQASLFSGADLLAPTKPKGDGLPPVEYTRKHVAISPCGKYRYRLERAWGPGPSALFCLFNPSTADGKEDDPTLRKCVGFARRWGCGSLVVVNLFARRATDPEQIDLDVEDGKDVVGPEADVHLRSAFGEAHARVVAGWGAHKNFGRAAEVIALARSMGVRFEAIRVTVKSGQPEHPLYLPYTLEPVPFEAA